MGTRPGRALSPFRNARPSGWASTRRRSPRLLGFPGARSGAGRTRRASLRRGRRGATESGERAAPRWRNPRPGWIPATWRSQATRRRRIKARLALGSWGFQAVEETTLGSGDKETLAPSTPPQQPNTKKPRRACRNPAPARGGICTGPEFRARLGGRKRGWQSGYNDSCVRLPCFISLIPALKPPHSHKTV